MSKTTPAAVIARDGSENIFLFAVKIHIKIGKIETVSQFENLPPIISLSVFLN